MSNSMELLSAAGARLLSTLVGSDAVYTRVVTDTRGLQPGDLFVALKGEHFDGHRFLHQAAAAGAVGAIVSGEFLQESRGAALPRMGLLPVADTLVALQTLASSWRRDFSLPVVGITGSNGKTTTKQLLAAVLAARGSVLATEGNLNNHIGVPLMLLRLRREHRAAVIEMGASNPGEIALLAKLARPAVGIVTQAGDAHLEGFGSREGVARAKGELFASLGGKDPVTGVSSTTGTAIINADDAYAPLWMGIAGVNRIISFGFAADAEVRAESLMLTSDGAAFMLVTPAGRAAVRLPLVGQHNVANALAAAAGGYALGLTPVAIAEGLANVLAPKGRVAIRVHGSGARIIDDTYNANPTSLHAGMELLAQESGTRILVLGDMAELGPAAIALHSKAGEQARSLGLEGLFALGPLAAHAAQSFGGGGHACASIEALVGSLKPHLGSGMTVLVKGSRSARMERVVAALLDETTAPGAH